MSVPLVPPPLAQLGSRRFSFHPAILNLQHNVWIYRRATWSEVLVQNTRTHIEVSVPRRYIGDITRMDEPVLLVGLLKPLEYVAGEVRPVERRVIEMPLAVNDSPRMRSPESRVTMAPVVGIRLEDSDAGRANKVVVAGVALGLAGCVLAISLYRGGAAATRAFYSPILQSDVPLTSQDDYSAVVRALGEPARERWQSAEDRQYQALVYPRRRMTAILMSKDHKEPRYIGAMDSGWHPIHSVDLAPGENSATLLRSLKRF
jgi:hypothetical protein